MSVTFTEVDLTLREGDELLSLDDLFQIRYFAELREDPKKPGQESAFVAFLRKRPGAVVLRRFRKGEVICRQGEAGWTAFYILETPELLKMRERQAEFAREAEDAIVEEPLEPEARVRKADVLDTETRNKALIAHQLRTSANNPSYDNDRNKAADAADKEIAKDPDLAKLKNTAQKHDKAKELEAAGQKDKARLLLASADRPAKRPPASERRAEADKADAKLASSLRKLGRIQKLLEADKLERESRRAEELARKLRAAARRPWLQDAVDALRQDAFWTEQGTIAENELAKSFPQLSRRSGEAKLAYLEHILDTNPRLKEYVDAVRKAEQVRCKALVSLTLSRQATGGGGLLGMVRRIFSGNGAGGRSRPKYIPIDGPVDLDYENPVARMYDGELFGEMSCMYRAPRSATIRAERDGYMLEMVRNVLDELMKSKSFKEHVDEVYRLRVMGSHLRNLDLFKNLDDALFERFCAGVQLESVDDGKHVFSQGDVSDCMYVIRSGQVRVTISDGDDERVLAYMGRGEVIGEIGMLRGIKRTANCVAYGHATALKKGSKKGRVELVKITRDHYNAVIQGDASYQADLDLELDDERKRAEAERADAATAQLRESQLLSLDRDARVAAADAIHKEWLGLRNAARWLRESADRPASGEGKQNKALYDLADKADAGLFKFDPSLLALKTDQKYAKAEELVEKAWEKHDDVRNAMNIKVLEAFRLDKEWREEKTTARALELSAARPTADEPVEDDVAERRHEAADRADAQLAEIDATLLDMTSEEKKAAAHNLTIEYRRKADLAQRLRSGASAMELELQFEEMASHKLKPKRLHQSVPVDPTGRIEHLGLLQGQKLMLIDLEKCTRCNECVRACISVHADGRPRLHLTGPRFEQEAPRRGDYLVPKTCRLCRDPVCMIGCPVGAIHKGRSGEIVIEDWCIGCGVCAKNCPYDSIVMHERLGHEMPEGPDVEVLRPIVATVCDHCSHIRDVPSCVYACPHEAAMRVESYGFLTREGPVEQRWPEPGTAK